MSENTTQLQFQLEGKFITDFAREKLHNSLDFTAAMNLLIHCLQSDKLSEEQIAGMAIKVLDGQAEIKGTYPGENYGYFETPNDRHKLLQYSEDVKDMQEKLEQLEKENLELQTKMSFIEDRINCDNGTEMASEYEREYGKELFSPDGLYSRKVRIRMTNFEKYTETLKYENNYGWLSPTGEFYPVPWSDHSEWALNWLTEHSEESDDIYERPTDVLIQKGWILLHNPSRGMPQMTKSPSKSITKTQANFLYDFFTERNMHNAAKDIMRHEYTE